MESKNKNRNKIDVRFIKNLSLKQLKRLEIQSFCLYGYCNNKILKKHKVDKHFRFDLDICEF